MSHATGLYRTMPTVSETGGYCASQRTTQHKARPIDNPAGYQPRPFLALLLKGGATRFFDDEHAMRESVGVSTPAILFAYDPTGKNILRAPCAGGAL